MKSVKRLIVLIAGSMLTGMWFCGDSPYVGLASKSAQVDSLIIKARAAGKTNMDSLRNARKSLAQAYIKGVNPNNVPEEDLSAAAKLFHAAGKADTSVQLLLKAKDHEAHTLLFNIYLQRERVEEAEAIFRNDPAPGIGDKIGQYLESLYWGYQERGDWDNALRIAEEGIASVPSEENLAFMLARAEMLYEKGLQSDAVAALRQLQIARKDDARAMRSISAKLTQYGSIGKPAPEWIVQQWIDSEPLTLRQLRGKVVFLDFFGPWCGPCRAMFPHMKKLYEAYHQQGLEILGVTRYYGFFNQLGQNLRELQPADELAWIEKFKRHHEIPFAYAVAEMEDGRKNEAAFGVYGIPHMVLIDKKGAIRVIVVGSGKSSEEKLDRGIVELLAE